MKSFKFFSIIMMCAAIMGGCDKTQSYESTSDEKTMNAQLTIENIMTRTSVRMFTTQPIDKGIIENIVKAGMAAPSAMNKQPWAFVVVTDREMLDSLNAHHPYANLRTATAAIIVCGDMNKTFEGQGKTYWVQDCSAASENILLAAHAYGLGAVWCGVYPLDERIKEVSEVLGLPQYIVPLNIISMGYPADSPRPKDKYNPDLIHYQKW